MRHTRSGGNRSGCSLRRRRVGICPPGRAMRQQVGGSGYGTMPPDPSAIPVVDGFRPSSRVHSTLGGRLRVTFRRTARYLLRADEGYRSASGASGSSDRVGVKGPATVLVLDLMHAVERRARAYEERCEANSRQYTLGRDRSQVDLPPRTMKRDEEAGPRRRPLRMWPHVAILYP